MNGRFDVLATTISGHKYKNKKLEVRLEWKEEGNSIWMVIDKTVREELGTKIVANYVIEKELTHKNEWKRVQRYIDNYTIDIPIELGASNLFDM